MKQNAVADFLAKLAREDLSTDNDIVMFESPPVGVRNLLYVDCIGAVSIRQTPCNGSLPGTSIT